MVDFMHPHLTAAAVSPVFVGFLSPVFVGSSTHPSHSHIHIPINVLVSVIGAEDRS